MTSLATIYKALAHLSAWYDLYPKGSKLHLRWKTYGVVQHDRILTGRENAF